MVEEAKTQARSLDRAYRLSEFIPIAELAFGNHLYVTTSEVFARIVWRGDAIQLRMPDLLHTVSEGTSMIFEGFEGELGMVTIDREGQIQFARSSQYLPVRTISAGFGKAVDGFISGNRTLLETTWKDPLRRSGVRQLLFGPDQSGLCIAVINRTDLTIPHGIHFGWMPRRVYRWG